jgi:hypothetical protein
MKNTMKSLIGLACLAFTFTVSGQDCESEIDKGRSGRPNDYIVHLEPGVTNTVTWNFTTCWFGIQNFTLYLFLPHGVKESSIGMSAENASTSCQAGQQAQLIRYLGSVDQSVVELQIVLDANAHHAVDVQVVYTAAFGGVPVYPPACP